MAILLVIDGLDGSGKETQSNILYYSLKSLGYNVEKITFPNYSSKSSEPVKMYLNGDIGDNPETLSSYACSAFYSIDRYITFKRDLEKLFEQEDLIIVTDRYVSANILHQAPKIKDDNERIDYYNWLYDLEFNKFGIPKEDIVIYLDMPIWKSQELIDKRYNGDEHKKDIHENNKEYLENCRTTAFKSVEYFNSIGDKWRVVNCLSGGDIRTVGDIADEILNLVYRNILKTED